MKFSTIALTLGAATMAVAQPAHQHQHLHAKRGTPIEIRAASVVEVDGPTATVYVMNGQVLSAADVEAGLASGKYVIVGDELSIPSSTAISSTATPTPSSSSTYVAPTTSSSAAATTSIEAAAFFAVSSSSSSYSSSSASSTYVAPSSTSTSYSSSSTSVYSSSTSYSSASSTSSSSSSTATGISADFPSGEIDCSTFPSAYGAVSVDWLGLDGWTGVQSTPSYSLLDTVISEIVTLVSGDSCTKNSFCSYACPAGYQKSQWPTAQGSTGESIGGLYCNSNGKLELSNSDFSTLCIAGTGGVTVVNNLSADVAVCRTDYPGTESETVPLAATAGSTVSLTCPDASNYYKWEGSFTSAQYYINPSGASTEDACQWGTSGSNMGNWAPVNAGVGKDAYGVTYLSLIPNTPTNPDGVLDYQVAITGDTSGTCYYKDGTYYTDSSSSTSGCTVTCSGSCAYEFSS